MIRIYRGGQLEKWRRFTSYLYQRGRHHKRQPWSCIPAGARKVPHWYRRKMKRRHARRMKRLEKMWARYRKPIRLTERQVKIKQKKEFIEELFRRIKIMAPYYRMKQKVFSCSCINAFEVLKRKMAVKQWLLDTYLSEQRLLLSQIRFLRSPRSKSEINKHVCAIDNLTKAKLQWAQDFKSALFQRKLINRRLAEKRKYFMNILVPLAEYYHKIKNNENVSVPKYFFHVGKVVYQEKTLIPKKTQQQRFLQMVGVSQMKFLELEEEAKRLKFYIRTRYYFTNKISKIISKLYYAKDVVLDLLRDGHEILTKMFHFYELYIAMLRVQYIIRKTLEKRRIRASYRRRALEIDVEFLLNRHRTHKDTIHCLSGFFHLKTFIPERKEEFVEALRYPTRGLKMLERRSFMDGVLGLTVFLWEGYKDSRDWERMSKRVTMAQTNRIRIVLADEIQWRTWISKQNLYKDYILAQYDMSGKISIRTYFNYLFKLFIKPKFTRVNSMTFVKMMFEEEDKRTFIKSIHNFYKLLKRTKKFRMNKLGHHHKMDAGNEYECMKTMVQFFNNFLAFRNFRLTREEKKRSMLKRIKRENIKKHRRLMELVVPEGISFRKIRSFNIYKKEFETLCPLCCAAERQKALRKIGVYSQTPQPVSEIRRDAKEVFFAPRTEKLVHDIEHCKEPAATFLLQIKILEDRREKAYLGKAVWINF